jgi:DMSO/TMAO reductase YedYZ heme-binding membrane subunit
MPESRPALRRGPALTLTIAALVGAAAAAVIAADGAGVEGVRLAIRITARTSVALFLLAFTAAPLARLFPGPFTRWQRANRRWLGLAFASSHAVHAAAIVALARLHPVTFGELVPPAALIFGSVGYFFVVAMAVTSSDRAVALLGPRFWKAIHLTGAIWLWGAFMNSNLSRALRNEMDYLHWTGVAILVAALTVRIVGRTRAAEPVRRTAGA